MISCPTCEYVVCNFSHISWGSLILMILLKMSLLTPSLMIRVVIPIAILFFLIFYLRFRNAIGGCQELFSMGSHISFFMSMAFVRVDYYSELIKPLSFTRLDPSEVLLFLFLFINFF